MEPLSPLPVMSLDEEIFRNLSKATDVPELRSSLIALNKAHPNSTCFLHLQKYLESILRGEKWALVMFDSMEKMPFGILYGHYAFLGNFDECLSAETAEFKGKYCSVDIKFGQPESGIPNLGGAAFIYGLCIPSSCGASDVEKVVGMLGMSKVANITVDDDDCWTNDPVQFSAEDWAPIAVLGCIVAATLCSTVYEVQSEKGKDRVTGDKSGLYSSFSLLGNWRQLNKIYRGPDNIGCLHGIRTLSMCWVVLAHEYMVSVLSPSSNRIEILEFLKNKDKLLVSNSFVSVDTFFLLSGLLVTLIFFREVSKKGSYDVPVSMIHRFMRITPAFAVMILIQSTIILRFGRGPLWNRNVGAGVEACRKNWWPALLSIQNFVTPESVCLGQSWYLSSDMQMFWLSPLLLYPLLLWPKVGLVLYFVYLAAALTVNVAVAIEFGLGPQLLLTLVTNQFQIDYVQTYMRLAPYIVGMGLAYIICGVKANKIRVNLSTTWVIIGWLASSGLCLGSIFGISYFLDNGIEGKVIESALYLAFHRLGWSLGLAWVIFACFAGYGGIINQILSWELFQVTGKLSYCMFLVHFSIQFSRYGIARSDFFVNDFEIVLKFLGTLFMTLLFSIPLHLLIEAPFCNLDRYIFRNVSILPYPRRKRRKHEEDIEKKESSPRTNAEGIENKGFHDERTKF